MASVDPLTSLCCVSLKRPSRLGRELILAFTRWMLERGGGHIVNIVSADLFGIHRVIPG
jgi:hypothetical protein